MVQNLQSYDKAQQVYLYNDQKILAVSAKCQHIKIFIEWVQYYLNDVLLLAVLLNIHSTIVENFIYLSSQHHKNITIMFFPVLLSSRPWSWSRGQICRSWSWTVRSWSCFFNKTKTLLISTVRSQPQSCDYYTSLRPTHYPSFDMMHASLDFMQSWNCICLYQRHLRQLKGCSATIYTKK